METAHLVLSTQFTKHLTELKTAYLMHEKPCLEINNIASPFAFSVFCLAFLTLYYWINVLEDSNLVTSLLSVSVSALTKAPLSAT